MNKKVLRIIQNVATYLFIGLCLVLVIVTIVSKKSDGAINVFGHQARIVVSESMEKCDKTDVSSYDIKSIPIKSMVFIELVPENEEDAKEWYASLNVGDVVTFRYKYDRQVTITHRIIERKENVDGNGVPTGGYTFTLKGDNRALEDDPKASAQDVGTQVINTELESVNYIIGKVTGQSVVLGYVIYALKNPIGIALIIIIPSVIILIIEIIKIVGILTEDKKKKAQEEKAKTANEIEELKRQLEQLKKSATENVVSDENSTSN